MKIKNKVELDRAWGEIDDCCEKLSVAWKAGSMKDSKYLADRGRAICAAIVRYMARMK